MLWPAYWTSTRSSCPAPGGSPTAANRPADAGDLLTLAPGESLTEPELPELTVPLLPWRHQRRFVELKRLVDEETVTPLLMCRFACLTDGRQMPLQAILYREFDLVEWLRERRLSRSMRAWRTSGRPT